MDGQASHPGLESIKNGRPGGIEKKAVSSQRRNQNKYLHHEYNKFLDNYKWEK
jgi:hypothetical protein